jgi:hypothetical protein
MENIFKLCSGLRDQGLVKEASELETNYLNYKRAQTLYETSKETGEDLVQSAHPKGSHKLEGVDSDEATIEDILDQHAKSVEMVNKKPTGKLSSAAHLLREVKKALGQASGKDALQDAIKADMDKINKAVARIDAKTNAELNFTIGSTYQTHIRDLSMKPTIDSLKEIQGLLKKLHTRLDPSSWLHYATLGTSGLSEDSWAGVQSLLAEATAAVNDALTKRTEIKRLEDAAEVAPDATKTETPKADASVDMANKIRTAIAQFNSLSGLLASDDPADKDSLDKTKAWLAAKAQDLNGILSKFNAEPNKEAVIDTYQLTLNKYIQAYTKIKQDWS